MTRSARRRTYGLVVAADQLPVDDQPGAPVRPQWRDSAGSALTGLHSVAAIRGSAWIGRAAIAPGPTLLDGIWLHPLSGGRPEADDLHTAYCADTLAPIYRDHPEPAEFRPEWTHGYCTVNRHVANAAARIAAPGGTVWVHDYHLQAVPGHLRHRRPDLRIGLMLHCPFPPAERFLQLPARTEILTGLLGADLVGLPDSRSVTNLLDLAGCVPGVTVRDDHIRTGGREVTVGAFPASVDITDIEWLASQPRVRARTEAIRSELNHPRSVLLSVGPPDPAEGVRQHLTACARLFAEGRLDPATTVIVHVSTAAADTPRYRRVRQQIDRQVAQINGEYAGVGRPVVHYVHNESHRHEMIALYRAADVMLATPLRAGTTLAAEEFLAARIGNTGRLVLSEFSGTASELTRAHIVNPHHPEALAAAIQHAVREAKHRSADVWAMRERIRARSASRRAQRFLSALRDRPAEREPRRPAELPA